MPHILLRFMAIDDVKKLKLSRRVASIWVAIAMGIAVCIGVVGNGMLSNAGAIAAALRQQLGDHHRQSRRSCSPSYGILPALMAGLDSLRHSGQPPCPRRTPSCLPQSSSVSENLLRETLHLNISEKKSMLAARITVVIIAILGVIIARNPDSSVFGIVSFAWAGFGAGFGPLVICSLFWKRTTLPGAIAGMVAGGAMVFIWKYLVKPLGGVFGVYQLLPAFLVGLLVIVIVSLCTKAPAQDVMDEFERARSNEVL